MCMRCFAGSLKAVAIQLSRVFLQFFANQLFAGGGAFDLAVFIVTIVTVEVPSSFITKSLKILLAEPLVGGKNDGVCDFH